MSTVKLNAGCGCGLLKGFLNIDKYVDYDELIRGYETKQGPGSGAYVEREADGSYPKFLSADIMETGLPDEYADYILLDNVIEHLELRNIEPQIAELVRLLKPTGVLCVVTPDFNSLFRLWIELIADKQGTFNDWAVFQDLVSMIFAHDLTPGEMHRSPMTVDLLGQVFANAGLKNVTVDVHPQGAPVANYDGMIKLLADPSGSYVYRCGTLIAKGEK